MPRRGTEFVTLGEHPRKKTKVVEEPPSLDVSFCDDEALPSGIVFTDVQQKKWRLGKPIGRGSFGRIYLASDDTEKEVNKLNARYVVKIEPHSNGPLFVEVHCLIRTARSGQVQDWRHQKNKKHFGMPIYIASGSFVEENTKQKYRFLVLPRYDIDLQKVIARTRVLDLKNVLVLAIQILDVLEYLHGQGYTHSDIKSSNLMLGFDGTKYSKVQIKRLSFQKETKEVSILSGRHRKPKTGKSRTSYYDDEDFTVGKSEFVNMKNNLKKLMADKKCRTLHRHNVFNLRQLSNCVNYEDMSSSVCSDQSYQLLLENEKKNGSPDEGFHEGVVTTDIYKEAVESQSNGQIYLLDYGLASKFLDSKGNHKDFGMDARKAHDGTLEYSSRDSHIGAHSRRSDLETLGYNLIDWLTGTLPWKTTEMLAEPDLVHALKKNFMSDVKSLLKTCFKTEFYPQFLEKFFQYVTMLDFTEKPDYDYCRSLFRAELGRNGCMEKDLCLNLNEATVSPVNRKKFGNAKHLQTKNTSKDFKSRNGVSKRYERENIHSLENDLKLELLKQTLNSSSDGIRKPCSSRNFFISDSDLVARLKKTLMPHDLLGKKLSPKNLRSKRKAPKGRKTLKNNIGKFGNFLGSARQFTWAEILAGNPEDIIRKDRSENDDTTKYRIRKLSTTSTDSGNSELNSPLLQKDYLDGLNPTYAMKEVFSNFMKKMAATEQPEVKEAPKTKKEPPKSKEKVARLTRGAAKNRLIDADAGKNCKEKEKGCDKVNKVKCQTNTKAARKETKKAVTVEVDEKITKKKTKKSTEVTFVANRRRLRSSKRNKN